MIDDFADRVDAAGSWTGVLTPVPNASSIGRAVGIDDALGPTALVGVTVELGQADAGRRAGHLPAHGVRATRRRLAGIQRDGRCFG